MKNNIKFGVWTPWAKVYCLECHGPDFPRKAYDIHSEEWKELSGLHEREPNLEITKCSVCGDPIQLHSSISAEHNLVLALQKQGVVAEMWQTGGMNSACGINKVNFNGSVDGEEHYYLVTYDFDGDGLYWLGSYGSDGEYFELETFSTPSFEEMVEHIKSLKDVERLPESNSEEEKSNN
jgi:hypothetical protein